jgi:hypothetical protein
VSSLTYVLEFHRYAGNSDQPTTAPGLTVTSRIQGGTLLTTLDQIDGDEAILTLGFATNKNSSLFFEWGTVTFGAPGSSSLTFSSIGAGTLLPPGPDGFRHGTIAYIIESGTGALEKAQGIIDSNFFINLGTNQLVDTHLGIIRIP